MKRPKKISKDFDRPKTIERLLYTMRKYINYPESRIEDVIDVTEAVLRTILPRRRVHIVMEQIVEAQQ